MTGQSDPLDGIMYGAADPDEFHTARPPYRPARCLCGRPLVWAYNVTHDAAATVHCDEHSEGEPIVTDGAAS